MQQNQIQWPRLLTEGLVIIASILLAFIIDAWWDNRQDRVQEREHLSSMKTEFEASIVGLEKVNGAVTTHAKNVQEFIKLLKSVPIGESVVVPSELLGAAITWRTSDVSTSTLNALIASGNLNLLQNVELRSKLVGFPAFLLDTTEDEVLVQHFAEHEMSTFLAKQGLAEVAYAFRQGVSEDKNIKFDVPASIAVKHTAELVGMLSARLVHFSYSMIGLPRVADYLKELNKQIEQELEAN
ncbi:MAG: hypothetical protein KJO69_00945 [Gammaproteobacteria bacterium]|nr:hypothetical protein [Gammaproteobacteria bacterium]